MTACLRLTSLALLALACAAGPAAAQKQGGTLRIYHRDNPPSASILEEATVSVNMPFMPVFNNLVMFDPAKSHESADTIVPDMATSWSWDPTNTKLTFKLHEGVKWHDGKPFTAKDVQCTWNMLIGKGEAADFRKNPRQVWYFNLEEVTTNGDNEVTFNLKTPQPSFLLLLASGYSPIYPCHVPQNVMRTRPVGTGPFKFVEFKRGDSIRLVRNPDYFKKGRPYLDAIDIKIIENRSTRILAFTTGEFDLTFPTDVSAPLMKDMKAQAPKAVCEFKSTGVSINLIVNRGSPPFDNADIRKAMSLALDRKAFNTILNEGTGTIGGAMLPAPSGEWVDAAGPAGETRRLRPGYREEPRRGAQADGGAGLRSVQNAQSQGRDPQHSGLPRSGRDPDRPAEENLHRRRAGECRYAAMVHQDRQEGVSGRPQPDRHRRRRSGFQSGGELHLQVGAQLHRILQSGSRQADLPAIAGRPTGTSARRSCGTSSACWSRTRRAPSSNTTAAAPAGSLM